MAGILDFLFQGSPPPSVTTYGSTQTGIPAYLSDYTQGLLNRSNAVAGEPFQPYDAARIAPFTDAQKAAQQGTINAQGAWRPGVDMAASTALHSGAKDASLAAAPWLNKAWSMPTGSDAAAGNLNYGQQFSPSAAGNMMWSQAATMNPFAAGSTSFTQASGISPMAAAEADYDYAGSHSGYAFADPSLSRAEGMSPVEMASGFYKKAGEGDATNMADPYYASASKTATGSNVDDYLNPYITNVTDRIAEMGQRNLTENLLPSMGDTFIRAGQHGSTRHVEEMGKALRNTQEGISREQGAALAQSFGQAQNQFQADRSREAQIGTNRGQLELGEMNARSSLGQNVGQTGLGEMQARTNIGQARGNIWNQEQQNRIALGKARGDTAAQEMGLRTQLGSAMSDSAYKAMSGYGALGNSMADAAGKDADIQTRIGQVRGALAGDDASRMGQLGQTAGNMTTMAADDYRDLSSLFGNIGGQYQSRALTDAAALDAVGTQGQNMGQRNLDLAYSDFLEQRDYPKQQTRFMNEMLRGLPNQGGTQSTTNTGPLAGATYQPSGLNQIVGGLSLMNSLGGLFKKDGGYIERPRKRYRSGGAVCPSKGRYRSQAA
jgi:hypothetical protein